jgi:hypothetical protein
MKRIFFAFAFLCLAAEAFAQGVPNFPQSVPANSVVGRLGIGPGPVQAIPFATLKNYLGSVNGPGSAGVGNLAVFATATGNVLADGGPITAFGKSLVGAANAAAGYGVLGVIPCAQTAALTGDITKAAGSCAVSSTYLSPLPGGVTRSLNSKLSDSISAKDYGVVCDGVTDTRVQLQQAINSTPIGGTLRISKQNTSGACIVGKGAGSYALIATRPIHILCDLGVAIQPTSALSTTSTVLHLVGSLIGLNVQTVIDGCFIGNPGSATRFGLHGIVFDTTTAGNYFRAPIVRNVFIQAGSSGSGFGIYCANNPINNPNGGIYGGSLGENSMIQGGIFLGSSGDSITIGPRAIIPQNGGDGADNNGIYVALVNAAGGTAGNLTFDNVNFSQSAGIRIDAGYNIIFDKGEYELQAPLTGTAIIHLSANVGTVSSVRIKNAQFQAISGIGNPLFINISSNAQSVTIEGNAIAAPTGYTTVTNASASLSCGPNYWQTGLPHISGTAPANNYGAC